IPLPTMAFTCFCKAKPTQSPQPILRAFPKLVRRRDDIFSQNDEWSLCLSGVTK
ncbi:hypothetical protein HispidOSU_029608, partial [Sigmodon hispidus]